MEALIAELNYLNELGERGANVLADYLAACGYKGLRGVCDGDPIWACLSRFGAPLEIRYTAVVVMGQQFPLADGVRDFIKRFDNGLYEELI